MESTSDFLRFLLAFGILAFPVLFISALFWLWKERRARRALETRFKGVFDADAEVQRLEARASAQQTEIDNLRADYKEKRAIYDRLAKEVAIFDEKLAFAEMGVYEPHFDFSDSETYKDAITRVRDAEKQMVSSDSAVICATQWSVGWQQVQGKDHDGAQHQINLTGLQ